MKITAIKFWASWCHPCKIVKPHFEKMKEEFPDFKFSEINIDENSYMTKKYNVKSLPTILLLDGENEIDRLVGGVNIASIRSTFLRAKGKNDK